MSETDFFNKLSHHYNNKLPFVVYSRPINNIIKCWLQHDDVIHKTTEFSESGFVFTPFDLTENSILFPKDQCNFQQIELIPIKRNFSKKLKSFSTNQSQKKEHIDLISNAIKFIQENNFIKVVLSRSEKVSLEKVNPVELFKRLFHAYKQAMVYCWYHPKVGLWLGATPELLFKTEGKKLTTVSLAGTQVVKNNKAPLWSEKEIEEQQIVTNFLYNETSALALKTQVSNTENVKAGQLWHLKTRITSQLKPDIKIKSIINTLHPTPAVCGFPKHNSKHFILKNENHHREFYTGFLGELNLTKTIQRNSKRRNIESNVYDFKKTYSNFYVNLRCMKIKNHKAIIYVGGGITKDSKPEKEWEETCNKLNTMMRVLF